MLQPKRTKFRKQHKGRIHGTAKGGMVFAVAHDLGLPVRYIGTGETIDDIEPFDAQAYVDGLFE